MKHLDITNMKDRYIIIFIFALLLALVMLITLLGEAIPPNAWTRTTMDVTEYRIREYYVKQHRLPEILNDLPKLEINRDSSFHDGWGRDIQYSYCGNCVKLLSLGKDNKAGGTGDNADIQVIFYIHGESETQLKETH